MPTTAFIPSIHGFKFGNSFDLEDILAALVNSPSWMVPNEDGWGLCGGMCFASLDRYFQNQAIPAEITTPPAKGDALFSELVKRYMDSLSSVGFLNVLDYQARPDCGDWWNWSHSLGHLTLTEQWPTVRRKLDEGIPVTLCLIRAHVLDPIWNNHQVVAVGYKVAGEDVTLSVYDPNQPSNDRVVVGFKTGQPNSALHIYQSPGPHLRGFLRVPYDRKEVYIPPMLSGQPANEQLEWIWTVLS